ncbi:MAG TPA: phospholipid carrier-dependent glycosyltransferase [Phycisphaerae bacterium]|nr:phospholipid carrier-dependent glycosyltransferase [Phycisphaerae bacterium]HRW54423.1 phospholipid carrier-dependent glycosyltransferase [Phycisphaerae bacterium]
MHSAPQTDHSTRRHWLIFTSLCVALYCVRGVFVLSVFPPLEGWDEYQHVAYVEYLLENGRAPIFNEDSFVPRVLHEELVRFPHSKFAIDQLHGIGAVSYEDFWLLDAPPTAFDGAPPIRLYQAQHSSLYYRLVAPAYAFAKSHWGFLAALTTLRAINLLFGAGAIAIALWAIGRLLKPGPFRHLVGLLLALQPLFLLNCARIANDAPAVLFGTAAVVAMLLMGVRPTIRAAILVGLFLGVGVLMKTTNLGLLPMAAFVFLYAGWKGEWRRAMTTGAIAGACFIAVTGYMFASNLQTFGMLTPMQEAIQNRADGKTWGDYVERATEIDWRREVGNRYLSHSLWRGGWSSLLPNWRLLGVSRFFIKMHEVLVCFGAVGWLWLLAPRNREERFIFDRPGVASGIFVLWLGVTAALCVHMLQTAVALPNVATNIWYAAVIFPWLLVLVGQGFASFPSPRMGQFFCGLLAFAFLGTEIYGTRVAMVEEYARAPWGDLARERLAQLHVSWWGPGVTTPSMIAAITLSVICLVIAVTRKAPTAPVDEK